jgi:hypothetical protein
MNRPIIFLTQTFLDLEKVDKMVAKVFFEDLKQTTSFWQNFDNDKEYEQNLDQVWRQFLVQGRLIESKIYKKSAETALGLKQEFDKELPKFYKKFSKPTLLFLGNLEKYREVLQDAMLKLLEEPPQNLQIILYEQNLNDLLPTIQSRSILVSLPKSLIFQNLDKKILEKTNKLFPKAGDFAKQMLNDKAQNPFQKDTERDQIDCWLWQLQVCLEELYKQLPEIKVAKALQKVTRARQLNSQNLLKKLTLSVLG